MSDRRIEFVIPRATVERSLDRDAAQAFRATMSIAGAPNIATVTMAR
jgi:hypothetical protein